MKLHFVIWHEKIERKSTSGMWIDFRLARFANNIFKWRRLNTYMFLKLRFSEKVSSSWSEIKDCFLN